MAKPSQEDAPEFMTDSANRSVARELYRAASGSLKTRFPDTYKLLMVSSQKNEYSFLYSSHTVLTHNYSGQSSI